MPTRVRSACPLDCPDACSLEVTVEDGRVARVEGAVDRNPLTAGFICGKVRRLAEHVHGPERIARPLLRNGPRGSGSFEQVSWETALDLVARRLLEVRDRFGGEAILPYCYGGSNGLLSHGSTDALLFRRLGASRLARTVCAATTGAVATAMYGRMPGIAPSDYAEARLIVVWGCNPQVSGVHLMPALRTARERGARLIVVDPRATSLARQADLHLAPRPGTDVVLALAAIRELFASGRAHLGFLAAHAAEVDELRRRAEPWTLARAAATADVPLDDLRSLVDLYAAGAPAALRCGWGVERNRNGGSAVAAILALPAVAGKFGVRGGGYTLSNSGAWRFAEPAFLPAEPPTRVVNMNRLGAALTALADPPVRLLFVYDSNALATTPNQTLVRRGLEREDLFTVVFDAVLTDTARWADVVLPATTFLEHRELARGYGAYVLQDSAPAIPPIGEARSNFAVFAELARRTGAARPEEIPDEEAAVRAWLESTGRGAELRAQLDERGWAAPDCGERPVQFVDVFPRTGDGRVHLVPGELDREAPEGLLAFRSDPATPDFPLALVSPATSRTTSSTFGQLHPAPAALLIHAEDATARGLADGDRVRVFNDWGEVVCRLRVSDAMRRGLVELPKGLWSHHTDNGATANALTPDALADLAGGACFNDARVEVEKLG